MLAPNTFKADKESKIRPGEQLAQGHTVPAAGTTGRQDHVGPWDQGASTKACVTSCSLCDFVESWTISELYFPHFKNSRKSSTCLTRLFPGCGPGSLSRPERANVANAAVTDAIGCEPGDLRTAQSCQPFTTERIQMDCFIELTWKERDFQSIPPKAAEALGRGFPWHGLAQGSRVPDECGIEGFGG